MKALTEQVAHLLLRDPSPGRQTNRRQGAAHPHPGRDPSLLLRLVQALPPGPAAVPDHDLAPVVPVGGAFADLLERHHATQTSTGKLLVKALIRILPPGGRKTST